ncbi:AAA family ATPase [Chloroflexota bacterium]
MGRQLTLVSAPTGYGKTTLVASWLNNKNHRSTWLSLDSEDNNPSRFLYYLVSALEQVCKFISPLTKTLLEDSHYAPSRAIVTAISNDIATLAEPLILMLDDYHAIYELGPKVGKLSPAATWLKFSNERLAIKSVIRYLFYLVFQLE